MKTLRMEFSTPEGKSFLLSLPHAKDGLTEVAVQTAMNALVTQNVFTSTLSAPTSAEVVDRTATVLFGA